MDIDKKGRDALKLYFRKNSIPTESHFAELIDGMLNQKDDGIVKLPGDPLTIAAAGDAAGPQKLINFYESLSEANPAWALQLNPRSDQNNPATARAGFSISDGQGTSRLFIDKATGNIGIGTTNPAGKLDIANLIRFGLDEGGSGPKSISFARDAGDEANAGKIAYKPSWANDALNIVGAGTFSNRKIKLWDNVDVYGLITASSSKTPPAKDGYGVPTMTSGIRFKDNPGGGGYDEAWIQYYARSGESCTLEIGVSNDADDHIALMPSGNVGIGINNPQAKLHVAGDVKITGHTTLNSVTLGGFSEKDIDEWPNAVWCRNTPANWDEGLIKHSSGRGFFKRAGFGIHIHASRDWGIWSSGWDALFGIQGGTGDVQIKGRLGTNGQSPIPRTPGWGGGIHTWDIEAEGAIWCAHTISGAPHDLAENYYSGEALEAGDVVSLDVNSDEIVRSDKPKNTLVAGVISTKPGVLLNAEHGDAEEPESRRAFPLALCGRVPCKVIDESGPINRGDFLVSSSTPGHAMKAVATNVEGVDIYTPGTILGKALEPLRSGKGIIEVFILLR